MTHRIFYIFYFIFLIASLNVYGIEKNKMENRVDRLAELNPECLLDTVKAIMPGLYHYDKSFSLKMIRKMAGFTKGLNDEAYLYCLYYIPAFSHGRELELLDSAYIFAKSRKLDYFLWDYYNSKSVFFRSLSVLDSSMIYILKARDISKNTDPEKYVQTLHQLGDLYFSVGMYGEAERYYQQVRTAGVGTEQWKIWREMVIRNNLALIDMKNNNYDEALSKFGESLQSKRVLDNYSDSLSAGYISLQIAQLKFKTGDYKTASDMIKPWYLFFNKYKLEEHLIPSYQLLIRLAINMNDKESVENYFALLSQFVSAIIPNATVQYEIDLISSEVYEYLGNERLAFSYFKKYSLGKDAVDYKKYTSGLIQLLAEKNYTDLENNLKQLKSHRIFLLIIVLILILSAVIIYLRSMRIYKLNQLLVEANQTKEKLFSIIAHDLRNPFNIILGYSDLLLEKYDDFDRDAIKSILSDLKSAGNSTFALLENLLHWSRAQDGAFDFFPEAIELTEMAQEVIKEINSLAKKKEIELINKLPQYKQVIYADRNMLTLVFRNLLTNAVKFSNSGGKVYIDMEYDNSDAAVFKIKDEGIGISPEKAKTLFKFEKSKSSKGTEGEKGTGLGLILCYEFIVKHGGKIWVESEEGKGSTFYFTIPGKSGR